MAEERRELTVRLGRRGEELHRSYVYAPYGHREELDRSTSWRKLGPEITYDGKTGAEAIAALLDRGRGEVLAEELSGARLVEVGELLFEILFGTEAEWGPLLRGLFNAPGGPQPMPPRHPVRVRICADDPLLAGMPWRMTAFHGGWLLDARWTFETATVEEADGHVELRAPCKILVVAPRCGDPPATKEHLADLKEALSKVSEHYGDKTFLAEVETLDHLEDALKGRRPDVVYYYGHGEVHRDQACLLLGRTGERPKRVAMADLCRLLDLASPKVVYVNACKSDASGWLAATHQLSPVAPCVIARRTTAWAGEAGATAVRWFDGLLRRGLDPVIALHRLPPKASTRGFEWATSVVATRYASWQTHLETPRLRPREPGLRLDRDEQRALAHKHVLELLGSPTRRVEAIVAYGAPGALVDRFGSQMRDYLESHRVCLGWKTLRDPGESITFSRPILREELDLRLEKREFENLESLLRRTAPPQGIGHTTPVLALDWGTFGEAHGQRLRSAEIGEWLHFAAEELTLDRLDDVRLLVYLAVEIGEAKHQAFKDAVEELKTEIRSQGFRLCRLPKLDKLTLSNVLDHLEESRNTTCLLSFASEAARLLYRLTQGNYQDTVALIEKAEEQGWSRFLRESRREAEDPTREEVVF